MQEKNPRDRREPYTGRFADPNDGARPRGSVPARPRAASAQPSRPSGFGAPEPPRRRPEASTGTSGAREEKSARSKAPRFGGEEPKRREKIRNKRSQAARLSWWEKLLIGVAVAALVVLVLALIFGRRDTYHQMPRIVFEGDPSYAPEASAPIEGEAASGEGDSSQYLVAPTPELGAGDGSSEGGEIDYSQYLVTPEPGASLSDAAAAAGANFDAANPNAGEAGA